MFISRRVRALSPLLAAALFAPAALWAQTYAISTVPGVVPSIRSLAIDSTGNVFAVETYRNQIFELTPAGAVSVYASTAVGASVVVPDNWAPRAVAFDDSGNLFVADASGTIRKITPGSTLSIFAGAVGATGSADGPAATAQFSAPAGIAVDSAGIVYVADTGNSTIRKITPAGVVTTWAGAAGQPGSADGTGSTARFNTPTGLATDASGDVFVADSGNHTIRKIIPGGVVTTVAGLPGNSGPIDGTGAAARFNTPAGVAVDASGNVFVADQNNLAIRKIGPSGLVSTIAGGSSYGHYADGVGAAVDFGLPSDVKVGAGGTLYIADSWGLRLGVPSDQIAITVQPITQTVATGSSTTLTVTATGAAPITYQW